MAEQGWSGALHLTFRLVPTPSEHIVPFLSSNGLSPTQILGKLPYDQNRSRTKESTGPDPRRYRDCRQLYETCGFAFEANGILNVTPFGNAVLRWCTLLNRQNCMILGRHAAYALSACQLDNPIGDRAFPSGTAVFPFSFVWRAMLALENRISSDELNRELFRTTDSDSLVLAIAKIAEYRRSKDLSRLGKPSIKGDAVNDRIIPWMSIASFGWTLIADKRETNDGYYHVRPEAVRLLQEAAQMQYQHRQFKSKSEYATYLSRHAALPPDLR